MRFLNKPFKPYLFVNYQNKNTFPNGEYINIVNIRFTIDNLHFDAAVDINWELHAYNKSSFEEENWSKTTAIEIYCLDNTDWDIKMIYQGAINSMSHTFVDFDNLIEETKKWIKEMSE